VARIPFALNRDFNTYPALLLRIHRFFDQVVDPFSTGFVALVFLLYGWGLPLCKGKNHSAVHSTVPPRECSPGWARRIFRWT